RTNAGPQSVYPEKRRSPWVVFTYLRHPFFLYHGLRCHRAQRNCRSLRRTVPLEIEFRFYSGSNHRLALSFVGLFVSPVRNWPYYRREMDSVLENQALEGRP